MYSYKKKFLDTKVCPTLGWMTKNQPPAEPDSISTKLRKEEGLEIHERARNVFLKGYLIKGNNISAAEKTQELLEDEDINVVFEATFLKNGFIAKADILKREKSGWHLIEVKSKVKGDKEIRGKDKEDLIDDIAYTVMVATKTGLNIVKCSLMLISKDFRLGMTDDELFTEIIYTNEVLQRAKDFKSSCEKVLQNVTAETRPIPGLKWECRNCDIFKACIGQGIKNHIFELPRLSEKKFQKLVESSIFNIEDMLGNFDLTPNQAKVKEAVISGKAIIDQDGINNTLYSIVYPIYYLDFETVQTALPLYCDIAPYEQIPTQYSIHIQHEPKQELAHVEYLSDPTKDCRRELAKNLISDCGSKGSIIVYTSFEKTRINSLIELFPDLKADLEALIERIADINKIISDNFYHPEFHGSFSIKTVLPVLVPDLSYENMDVSNGLDASATFAYLAKSKYDETQFKEKRKQLLEYCKFDTLAMVKLHEHLMEIENVQS